MKQSNNWTKKNTEYAENSHFSLGLLIVIVIATIIVVITLILVSGCEHLPVEEQETKEWNTIESSSYFDIEIESLSERNLIHTITFKKDINVWSYKITFVNEEGEDYKWECLAPLLGKGTPCYINYKFWTRGTKEKITAEFDSNVDNISGTFYFYIREALNDYEDSKMRVVAIKHNIEK